MELSNVAWLRSDGRGKPLERGAYGGTGTGRTRQERGLKPEDWCTD